MKGFICGIALCAVWAMAGAGEREVKSTRAVDNNRSMACGKAKDQVERFNNSFTRVVKMNGCECSADGKDAPILYSCSVDFVVERRK